MPRTIHRFPLNLADPCTRGWGGAYLNPSHASYWVIVTALLLPSMYDATIGPFLTPWVGLWLPLWCAYGLFLYLRRLAYFNPRYAPRPRVVCDPRGITLHDAFGRIRHQWRWAAVCYWSRSRANPSATAVAIWITLITTTLSPRRSVTCAVVRRRSSPSSRRPILITAGTSGATVTLFTA